MHVTRQTVYEVKNNSTSREVSFFIDHKASSHYDGFDIKTTDRAIKSVVGFTRYEFNLKPSETLVFTVEEDATYMDIFTRSNELIQFLNENGEHLLTHAAPDVDFTEETAVRDDLSCILYKLCTDSTAAALTWVIGECGGDFVPGVAGRRVTGTLLQRC